MTYQEQTSQIRRLVDAHQGSWDGIDPDAVARMRAQNRFRTVDVVAVTNEVGLGVLPAHASGRLFRDELGRLNTRLSAASDQVHLVAAGRVLDLSDAPLVAE